MKNPLLETEGLPAFNCIRPEHVESAVQQTLNQQRAKLRQTEKIASVTFESAEELERIQDVIHRVWSPIAHLNAVLSTPELRDAYNNCLPMIAEFSTEMAQNGALYALYSQLEQDIDPAEKIKLRLLSHTLRAVSYTHLTLPTNREV